MLSLFLGALFLSLGGWLVFFSILNFHGMALMGRISARREKKQFEVQRRSSVSKKLLDLKGWSPLAGTFIVNTRLWTCRYVETLERFYIHSKRNFLGFWRRDWRGAFLFAV